MKTAAWRPDDVTEAEMQALDVDLERTWYRIEGDVWATPVHTFERLAGRWLGSPALARVLATTPSLLLAWLIATVVVLALGVLVTGVTGQPFVVVLAPAVAALAVAFAYGAGTDPVWELCRTMAVPQPEVVLIRIGFVFVTNAVLGLVAMLVSPQVSGVTTSWLLPMAAMSLLALAVASLSQSASLGGTVGVAVWSAIVLGAFLRTQEFGEAVLEVSRMPFLLTYLAIGVACGVIAVWSNVQMMRGGRWLVQR